MRMWKNIPAGSIVSSRPDARFCRTAWRLAAVLPAVTAVFLSVLPARAGEIDIKNASSLMDRGLYTDAVKALKKVVEQQGDDGSVVELRLLAEACYQARDFGNARTYYLRALPRQTNQKAKIVCESRLAILDYRLGDMVGAEERIADFIRKYPNDERVGALAVIRLRIVQESALPRPEKIKKMSDMYEQIKINKEQYGYYNVVLAAQALSDLYMEAKEDQKAVGLLVTAVHEMRTLIAAEKAAGRPLSTDMQQGVDGMALQVAKFYMAQRNWAEAQKWLENVSYSPDMLAQANYLLAQLFYQNRKFADALSVLSPTVLDRIPEGETKNAAYLLIAFCQREVTPPNLEKAKEVLRKIPATSSSYAQAQQAMGDIYRDQKDIERAEQCYQAALTDTRFAAAARFSLGVIYKERGDAIRSLADADKKQRESYYKKAGEHFQELMIKYPLTDLAKQAKPLVAALQAQGVTVATDISDEERIAGWEKTIKEKPNSNEAAQALLSMAQHYSRAVLDSKTKTVIKAPDWESCAKACQPLVQSQTPYTGVTAERWREIRMRALYLLARAELGSLPVGASGRRLNAQVTAPIRLAAGGSTERAIKYLTEAQTLVGAQATSDDARTIEYAMIEAMLKSDDKAVREQGEKRYASREAQYGGDPVFQQLSVITADWLDDHGFHEMAGRTYRTVARKANMERDQVMHLLHLAGLSYGRGGRALIDSGDKGASIAFVIQPPSVVQTASDSPAKAPVFQLTKRILWEQEGPDLSAAEALARVSKEFDVPFVWAPEETPDSIATYLKKRIIPRATIKTWRETASLAKILSNVVDMTQCSVDIDMGISGGTPTLKSKTADTAGIAENPTIEIFKRNGERFAALSRTYGSFSSVHGGNRQTMLFAILKKIEETTGGRVLWADGVQKDEVLAREFKDFPGIPANQNVTCRKVLDTILPAVGLRYTVVARDYGREMIRESISCFDELRKFGADSLYAEDSMFNIAVNLYILKDYGKMKLLLREYLKTYDNPSFAHYYDACFWLGRLFELERNYREAVKYYSLAAEEKIVLYRPPPGAPIPTLDEVKKRLGYETLFSLSRKVSGAFKDAKLQVEFLNFIRFHANLEIGLDASARSIELPLNLEPFMNVPCIDVLYKVMIAMGLDLRSDNGDKDVAEKAYYRLATVYKEDNLMHEALENLQTLLARFPNTPRTLDALALKLDICKGLRDYNEVLATLDQIRAISAGKIEEFKLDYELGRVYFDLCNYTNAETCFVRSLKGAGDSEDLLKIRDALAQTYQRQGNREQEALALYRDNRQYETSPLRQSIYAMMIHSLEYATSRTPRTRKPLPPAEADFIGMYEKLTDAQRAEMSQGELARATWIYYALALEDLLDGNSMAALNKLTAAGESPDDALAAEALYQSALIYLSIADPQKARECLEHLLFSTKAIEPAVKATYQLTRCLKALGDNDAALQRMNELVTRYSASPYADLIRRDPLYRPSVPAATSTNAPPAAPGAPLSAARPAGSATNNAGGASRP